MSRIPETKASFFQILIDKHFALSLRIPRDFVEKHREVLPEKYAKLRICTGRTWDVKLKQIDGDHYFTKGWTKFAIDLELERLEFLVFTFSHESTFDVAVYGTDGCEKKPPSDDGRNPRSSDDEYSDEVFESSNHKKKKKQSRTCDDHDHDGDERNTNPKFEIVFKAHQKSRMTIRKHFAEAAGLIGKKEVAMEYVGGSRSNVVLDLRPDYRLDLAAGWPDFRTKNRLSYGKTYSFEFIPCKQVIQVKNIIRSRKSWHFQL